MESTVKQRLIDFLSYKRISQGKFEKACGLSVGYVNNIVKGIGGEKLQSILSVYPELNPNWLMKGEGTMLLPSPTSTSIADNNSVAVVGDHNKVAAPVSSGVLECSVAVVEQYEKRIEELQEQNKFLKSLVERLTAK